MLNTPLTVKRTFSNGHRKTVGKLAENRDGTYFQYDEAYLEKHPSSIAPFNIKADLSLQKKRRDNHTTVFMAYLVIAS